MNSISTINQTLDKMLLPLSNDKTLFSVLPEVERQPMYSNELMPWTRQIDVTFSFAPLASNGFKDQQLKENNTIASLNLDDYCFCSFSDRDTSSSLAQDKIEEEKSMIGKRRKRNPLLQSKNLDQNIYQLYCILNNIKSSQMHVIMGSSKAAQKAGGPICTRSQYIGVSRNGRAWQSLISIRKRKTYIGTYEDERHAALAFDFYSILLCGLSAVTNWNYTKDDILGMLHNYQMNDYKFDPVAYNLL